MGRFQEINTDTIVTNDIDEYLKSNGFSLNTPSYVRRHRNTGWSKGYNKDAEYVRVHITKNVICIYAEYHCGGHLWDDEINIPTEALDSVQSFTSFMDDVFDDIF